MRKQSTGPAPNHKKIIPVQTRVMRLGNGKRIENPVSARNLKQEMSFVAVPAPVVRAHPDGSRKDAPN